MLNQSKLIHRCRQGDREAQRQLFELTSSRIYNLLLRMTGSPEDAVDLTQETYIRGFARIPDFDGRASVLTWLHRIAVNEALQLQRRKRMANGKHREIAAALPQQHDGNGRLTIHLDVASALQSLTLPDRTILLLRYQENCDYKTIGEILGVPPGTVASQLSRARERLRDQLKAGYATRQPEERSEEQSRFVHQTMEKDFFARRDGMPARGEATDV